MSRTCLPRAPRRGIAVLLFAFLLCGGVDELVAGVTRTFTARDGRTIEAELLSYRGDTLRVRRTDTNAEFTLPLPNLSTEDQKAVLDLMEKHPELREAISANALRVETSRTKLTPKEKENRSVNAAQELEAWAYDLTVVNLTNYSIPSLRVEYAIVGENEFASSSARSTERSIPGHKGTLTFKDIAGRDRQKLRTEPLICSTLLEYRSYYVNGLLTTDYSKPVKRIKTLTVRGFWFRVYDGDKLVLEQSMPESLMQKEKWDAVENRSSYKDDMRFKEFFSGSAG